LPHTNQRRIILGHRVDVTRLYVANLAGHRQPILGEANEAGAQVAPDLFVLEAVKAVLLEEALQVRFTLLGCLRARQQGVHQQAHRRSELRPRAHRMGKEIQLGAPARGKRMAALFDQAGQRERIVRPGEHCPIPFQQAGHAALLIDGKVIDHRVHGKGQGMLQAAFFTAHHLQQGGGRTLASLRRHHEPHPAARHAAQHPESPVGTAQCFPCTVDDGFHIEIRCPGDDGLDGAEKVTRGRLRQGGHGSIAQHGQHLIQNVASLLAGLPLGRRTQQIALGYHLQDRPHVLGHPPVNQHQALL